jgi:hypothetical protein
MIEPVCRAGAFNRGIDHLQRRGRAGRQVGTAADHDEVLLKLRSHHRSRA